MTPEKARIYGGQAITALTIKAHETRNGRWSATVFTNLGGGDLSLGDRTFSASTPIAVLQEAESWIKENQLERPVNVHSAERDRAPRSERKHRYHTDLRGTF